MDVTKRQRPFLSRSPFAYIIILMHHWHPNIGVFLANHFFRDWGWKPVQRRNVTWSRCHKWYEFRFLLTPSPTLSTTHRLLWWPASHFLQDLRRDKWNIAIIIKSLRRAGKGEPRFPHLPAQEWSLAKALPRRIGEEMGPETRQ